MQIISGTTVVYGSKPIFLQLYFSTCHHSASRLFLMSLSEFILAEIGVNEKSGQ